MSQRFKRKFAWSATLGFCLWILGFSLYHFQLKYSINEADVKAFETSFQEKSAELESLLQQFLTGIETRDSELDRFEFARQYAASVHTDFFIYTNDTLTLWTSNNVPVSNVRDTIINDGNIIRLDNGWYKFEFITQGEKLYVAAMLIKYEYDFENDELINKFSPHLLPDFKGKLVTTDEGYPVHNKYGKRIFNIAPLEEPEKNTQLELIIFFCYLFAIIILVQLLIWNIQKNTLRLCC